MYCVEYALQYMRWYAYTKFALYLKLYGCNTGVIVQYIRDVWVKIAIAQKRAAPLSAMRARHWAQYIVPRVGKILINHSLKLVVI